MDGERRIPAAAAHFTAKVGNGHDTRETRRNSKPTDRPGMRRPTEARCRLDDGERERGAEISAEKPMR